MIRRREFITLLGGPAAWPLAASAQQGERMRRIGVFMPFDENDLEGKRRYSAFIQALADLGWTSGRNVRMDLRWYGDDTNRMRALGRELVSFEGMTQTLILREFLATSAPVPNVFPNV